MVKRKKRKWLSNPVQLLVYRFWQRIRKSTRSSKSNIKVMNTNERWPFMQVLLFISLKNQKDFIDYFFVVHQILIHLHYLPDLLLQVVLLEKWEGLLIPYRKWMAVVRLFQAVLTFQIEPLAIHHIIINNNNSLGKGYKDWMLLPLPVYQGNINNINLSSLKCVVMDLYKILSVRNVCAFVQQNK